MGLAFFETMRGTLTDVASGRVGYAQIEIKCEAARVGVFARTGATRLTGLVRARPWVVETPAEGSLIISPLRRRAIAYDLRFHDDAGVELRLHGQKDLRLSGRLFGLTELFVKLSRGGETLAHGTLHFRLDDLPSFTTSLGPYAAVAHVALDGPSPLHGDAAPYRPILDERERAIALALAEVLIVPGRRVPRPDDETMARALRVLASLPPTLRRGYRAALRGLDRAARARYRGGFAACSPAERQIIVEAVTKVTGAVALKALAMPLEVGHFGRRAYLDALGGSAPAPPAREPPARWTRQIITPEALEAETTLPCDVVVIGTGAGGAPLAAALAERGHAVALVEAGRYHGRSDFSGPPEERLAHFWRSGGAQIALGDPPIVVPTGRLVGGSTAINSGTAFDTPAAVLESWRARGFPEDFAPDHFRRHLDAVRRELGVSLGERPWLGAIADRIAAGAESMRREGVTLEHGPLPRNAPGCDGQGECCFGCPTGAKRSADQSWIPRALRAGAQCFTGLTVRRILFAGGRAVAVEALGQDLTGAPRRLRLLPRVVVVAGGALASPGLLAASGVRLPRLGRGLSVHPAIGAMARFDEPLGRPWRAIPQSYGVEGLVDPRLRFEGFASPPALTAPTLPFHGAELTRWMDNLEHVGHYGFMVRDGNDGRVRPGPGEQPIITKRITPDVLDLLRRGAAALVELMLRGGAVEVATGIAGVGTVRGVEQARAIARAPLRARAFRLMAFHPLGTCAMGPDARAGVVDFEHRVFGTHNVYVVDGASVPTSLGVNPQVTIMAMALRAAELLDTRLR